MGRKKTQPRHMGDEQRQEADWNMLDGGGPSGPSAQQPPAPEGQLIIMGDEDPALKLEWEAAEQERKLGKSRTAESETVEKDSPRASTSSCSPSESGSSSRSSSESDDIPMPQSIRQYFARQDVQQEISETRSGLLQLPMYSTQHFSCRKVLDTWHWVVGSFKVELSECDDLHTDLLNYLPNFHQCWLCFCSRPEDGHSTYMYFEVRDEEYHRERQDQMEKEEKNKTVARRVSSRLKKTAEDHLAVFWPVVSQLPHARKFLEKLTRSGQKKYQLVYEAVSGSSRELQITVYGRKESLQKLDYPSQGFATREANTFLLLAMDHFYSLGPICDRGISSLHQDFQELYEGVRALQSSHSAFITININLDVQHPSLKPVLRRYQQDAVRWMLQQERFGEEEAQAESESEEPGKAEEDSDLHPLYTEVTTHCGKTLFYNRQGGSLIQERPQKAGSPPGGILADEMGLGKTVEVLCCLLLHPRPPIPPPARLPTLMETEYQSEESSRDASLPSASSSFSDLQSLGNDAVQTSQGEPQATLKRADSNTGSLSSVPSDVVSIVVTDDHTYQAKTGSEHRDHPEADMRPPLRLTLKRRPSENAETPNSDSQPPAKKQCVESGEKTQKIQGEELDNSSEKSTKQLKKKGKTVRKTPQKVRRKGRVPPKPRRKKIPELSEDKNSSEAENACKKPKGLQSGKYFFYVADDEDTRPTFFQNRVLKAPQRKFECVCGKVEDEMELWCQFGPGRSRRHLVKCTECGTSQHAECVNYDLQDPFRGPYKCPHCHYNGKQLPSGATLIISPYSIAHQWINEIQKHVQEKSLKVFEYKGVRYQGYIQPQTLVNQDIVITTYETLRNDLNYVNIKPTNSDQGLVLRKRKKFMAHSTPLTAVEWWRICLDEAQMVESGTTKTAEMALRLSCVNRWCVTGTPLNQSIKDMFGLLAFIGYDPYCVEEWWTRCLYEPYLQGIKDPMFQALAKVMWRNSMKDVKAQLQLPDKSEVIKHLKFSPVEEVFYSRLFQKCSQEIFGATARLSEKQKLTKLRKLDHHTVNKYLNPLRKLRQACCHPQAVSGSNLSMKNSLLTMEELLDNLVKKTSLECVESHRNMVAAMNAQAGLCLIEQLPRVAEAVEMYRAVLRSVEEHEKQKQLKTDALPQIHALHNLAQVLAASPPGVGHTTRDDQLTAQCEDLKAQYRQRASNLVEACKEQLVPLQNTVTDIMKQLGSGLHWYQLVLQHARQSGNEEVLVQRVKGALADTLTNDKFRDLAGLQYRIVGELMELVECREPVLTRMDRLRDWDCTMEAIHCCIRPALTTGLSQRTCLYCQLEKQFLEWEERLFSVVVSRRTQAGMENVMYRGGSWQNNPLENILRVLQSYAKTRLLDGQIVKDAALVISLFDTWKKEFKQLRLLWALLKEEAGSSDELEMAVTRMRLAEPGEELEEQRDKNICDRVELPALLRKFTSDQKIYERELKVRCGQLDYLRNLAKGNPGHFEDGINPEECPICQSALGQNWSVLRCAHRCCLACLHQLMDRCPASRTHDINLTCMVCRQKTRASDISYISTTRSAESQTAVKGSHSTKVGAIVQCLSDIQREDPEAKALVFATWVDVLKVIGKALDENFISYTQLYDHGHHYEKNITRFRMDKTVGVLLLPYSTGSKGLNLFEANHVLLVEPTYSPSEEAQAIGRVYRMGQTRPTKIYRFLVKATIEERIQALMEGTLRPATHATQDAITLGQLISLFQDAGGNKLRDSDNDDDDDDDADNHGEVSLEGGHAGASSGGGSGVDFAVAGPSRVADDGGDDDDADNHGDGDADNHGEVSLEGGHAGVSSGGCSGVDFAVAGPSRVADDGGDDDADNHGDGDADNHGEVSLEGGHAGASSGGGSGVDFAVAGPSGVADDGGGTASSGEGPSGMDGVLKSSSSAGIGS